MADWTKFTFNPSNRGPEAMTYQKGAEDMREAAARHICPACRDGISVKRCHNQENSEEIVFIHPVGSLGDGRGYGNECAATAIWAIDVETLK